MCGGQIKLSKEDVLREARSLIRDMVFGFSEKELAEDPRIVCQNLSEIWEKNTTFKQGT